MTSSEFPPQGQFTVDQQGANGVGGYIPYGLKLEGGLFIDPNDVRHDPSLMHCPEHAAAVESSETAPQSRYTGSPGADAEAGRRHSVKD